MAGNENISPEAEEARQRGNALFKEKEYVKAINAYNQGIKMHPKSAVLLSNRSAAFLALDKDFRALKDAQQCVEIEPSWVKGYYRLAQAQEKMEKYDEAIQTIRKALEVEPLNKELVALIERVFRKHPNGKHEHQQFKRERSDYFAREKAKAKALEEKAAAIAGSGEAPQAVQSGEEYEAAKKVVGAGKPIPYSQQLLETFISTVEEMVKSAEPDRVSDIRPMAYFLPGFETPEIIGNLCGVSIDAAFENPSTLAQCVDFLRKYGEDTGSHACMLVIPKSNIGYPQVWKGASKANWPFKQEAQGVFVQLEAPGQSGVYFWEQRAKTAFVDTSKTLVGEPMTLTPPILQATRQATAKGK